MKLLRPTLALMIVTSIAAGVSAQGVNHRIRQRTGFVPPNPQALVALQTDLNNAIDAMKLGLPIYDGFRVRSIHATHSALVLADTAINGAKAFHRVLPNVKDHISSGTAHSKFTPQQIAASQANMRKGYAFLQQATKDLEAAAGSKPNSKAIRAAADIKVASSEATMAISLHGGQP